MLRLPPPGYVKDEARSTFVKDPDKRVQEAIRLVFDKFRELWSIRQTFLWFQSEGIELPVNKSVGGKIKIVWQLPTYAMIKGVLTNACYAGAYLYGRRPTEKVVKDGKVVSRVAGYLQPEECKVFIPDHHEGYIDWKTYEENRKMISANSLKLEKDESVTAIRGGQGILVGILRCARCGQMLHVRYWGKSGTAARYACKGDYDAGGKYCLAFGGSTVDRRFSEEMLKVVSPLGMRASLEAVQRLESKTNDRRSALERQIQQMQYEARRAFEQYNEVDPRNRLVAEELERRWNEKLEQVEGLQLSLSEIAEEQTPVSDKERRRILQMGENFREVWESEHCTSETKKKIIRTVVEEVIVDLNDSGDKLHFIIHWKGGSHTDFEMEKPRSGVGQKTSLEDLEIIRQMSVRYGDDEIARVLTKLGRRTARGKRWSEQRVYWIRRRYAISGQKRSKPDPEVLTLARAAKYCNVSQGVIKRLVDHGILKKEQVAPWAPWEINRIDLDCEPVNGIIDRLHKTGKLMLKGDKSEDQMSLF